MLNEPYTLRELTSSNIHVSPLGDLEMYVCKYVYTQVWYIFMDTQVFAIIFFSESLLVYVVFYCYIP